MMARTQITLDPEMHRRARRKAADMGCSLAEYLRQLVARYLGANQPKVDVSSIFNLGDSGGSDIAKYKDQMIYEALDAAHPRRPRKKRAHR